MEYDAGPPYEEDDGYEDEADPAAWEPDADPATSELHEPAPEAPAATEAEIASPPLTETLVLSARLQAIVDTAERSAEELRAHAEQRASERIAEAQRAAEYRVQAAEEDAAEIVAEARAKAQEMAAEAVNAVDSIHAEAHAALREAKATLAQAQLDAEKLTKEAITKAREEAREIVRAAHVATREVMDDGSELSAQLRELSSSLRNNAERLLRDIRLAHGSMTARLDQALPEGSAALRSAGRLREAERASGDAPRRRSRPEDAEAAVDFEVPDFVVGEE